MVSLSVSMYVLQAGLWPDHAHHVRLARRDDSRAAVWQHDDSRMAGSQSTLRKLVTLPVCCHSWCVELGNIQYRGFIWQRLSTCFRHHDCTANFYTRLYLPGSHCWRRIRSWPMSGCMLLVATRGSDSLFSKQCFSYSVIFLPHRGRLGEAAQLHTQRQHPRSAVWLQEGAQ